MVKDKLAMGVLVTAFLSSLLWAGSLYAPVNAMTNVTTNYTSKTSETGTAGYVIQMVDPNARVFTTIPPAIPSCKQAGATCATASECCDDTDPCTTPVCSGAQVTFASPSTGGTCTLQAQAGCTQQCKALGSKCVLSDTCCPDSDNCTIESCGTVEGQQGTFCRKERSHSCPACTSNADCADTDRCTQDYCVSAGPYAADSFSTCRNVTIEGCSPTPTCGDGILDPGEDCDLGDANGPADVYICQPRPPADGSPDRTCDIPSSRFSWFEPDGKLCFANASGDPLCATQAPPGSFTLSRSQDGTTMIYSYGFAGPAAMDFTDFTLSSTVSAITTRFHFGDSYDAATQTINFCPESIELCYRGECFPPTPVPPPQPGRDPCYHYRLQDRCNDTCQEPRCGDTIVDPGTPETCDDGDTIDDNFCRNNCTRCGDSVPDPGEQCDDGNEVETDACKKDCTTPPPPPGDPCIHFAEEGNWQAYDCCRAVYVEGSPEDNCCDAGHRPGTDAFKCCLAPTGPNCTPPRPECVTDADCDDHDPCTMDECGHADGVNGPIPMCQHGHIRDCTPPKDDPCQASIDDKAVSNDCFLVKCGDGIVQSPPEQCDNGGKNADLPNECRSNCKLPYCGDKIVDDIFEEECDDGNEIGADGCNKCLKEICGNGRIDPGEICDPGSPLKPAIYGPVTPKFGGITLDKYLPGITKGEMAILGTAASGYTCKPDCTGYEPECGDGNLDKGEACDPPGSIGKDGGICTDLCTYTKPSEKCVEEKTARDSAYAKWDAGQDPEGAEFFAAAQVYCDCTGVQTLLCKHDDCPPCEGISDPALKACCEKHGGLTVAASEECVPDSDNPGPACQILFPTVEVAGFTFVNNGNICCNLTNAINSTLTDSGWQQCINGQLPPPGPGQPPLPPLPPLDICTSYLAAFGEMPPACLSLCQANPEAPECKDGPIIDPAGRALISAPCDVTAVNPEDMLEGQIIGIGEGGNRVPLRVCLKPPSTDGILSGKGLTMRFMQTDGRLSLLEGMTPDAETDQFLAGPKMLKSVAGFDPATQLCTVVGAPLPKSMIGQDDQTVGFKYELQDLLGRAVLEATCRSQPLFEATGGAGGEGCSCGLSGQNPARDIVSNLLLVMSLLFGPLVWRYRQRKRALIVRKI